MIILGFFLAVTAFYYLEVVPALEERARAEEEAAKKIPLTSLVEVSQALYDEAEQARGEGALWQDPKSGQWIVTLGALQGLDPGQQISVYEDHVKAGAIVVDKVFDVISYVRPAPSSLNLSGQHNYQVMIE